MNEVKNIRHFVKFIIPSLLAIFLFLTPLRINGESVIIVGFLVNYFKNLLNQYLPTFFTIVMSLSSLISLAHKIFKIEIIEKHKSLESLFETTWFWLIVRLTGSIFAIITLLGIGPEIITSIATGGNILFTLLPTVGMWFVVAGMLLPLLTDYGLMEFLSSLFHKIARPLFKVPGRSLIDCISSWLGSGVMGAYLTISQYERGFYTLREAAIIITNFSIMSISFCFGIAQYLGIDNVFGKYYLTIIIVCFVCAIVTPRLWPICKMSDTYDDISGKQIIDDKPKDISSIKWGYNMAMERASKSPNIIQFLKKGMLTSFDLIANVSPTLMTFGTIALVLVEYTNIFVFLSFPFELLLSAFGVPYAQEAAPAMILGFADQYIPVIIGSTIPSFYTRFLCATISIVQVIYITEIGSMILTSRVKLNLWQLFIIFIERTLIALPIIIFLENLWGFAFI